MGNTNRISIGMSDAAIVAQIGQYIKHVRIQQNKTQSQLAEAAGLNRWTLSQIEGGASITLSSLVQLLRALDCLHVLHDFAVVEEISPLEYAKMKKKKKKKRERVRNQPSADGEKEDLGW